MRVASALALLIFFSPASQHRSGHPAAGVIEHVDAVSLSGWATDADSPGTPLTLHVYVDDVLFDTVVASAKRHDGKAGFHYRHSPFGAGRHRVTVYALGVDETGAPDGRNESLAGSPAEHDFGCEGFGDDQPALTWCKQNPEYWMHRQSDTAPLFNRYVWIGVNNSYGGLIAQLYGEDRSMNLLQEHGGSAMQVSLWGYESRSDKAPDRFYRKSPPVNQRCDATPYETLAACTAGGQVCDGVEGSPPRPQRGRQVTTCDNVCNGWEVAAPWNPLQAQGARCAWDDRARGAPPAQNDVTVKEPFVEDGKPGWHTVHTTVNNFTKGMTNPHERHGPFPGLSIDQRVTLGDVYAKVQYTIRYAAGAPYVLGVHAQELPAIYTGKGLAAFAYRPGQPERAVCTHGTPGCCAESDARCVANHRGEPLARSSRNLPPTGGWWGVCDGTRTKCLTVATFDGSVIARDTIEKVPLGYGTLTAAADFALTPGTEKRVTIYLFPYKYDAVIEGRSILDRIAALRPR